MFGVRHRHRSELHSQIRERVAKSDHRQNIHEQLDFLKIAHLSSKYPAELSGGERQRVAIARALSSEADILLMDEPFASLDRANRDNAIQLLLSVQTHYQKAMILVTHSPEEADAFPGDHLEILSGKPVSLKRRIGFLDESVNS
jgi:ABC-type nitrate/sulfonate/bicarbonate transport system ATPase subunit